MLQTHENEYISRVGPGTPMGALMRQYWVPALLSAELPRPDCPPVRVLLLGEKLIAFRDSGGQVGLLDNFCPHRGGSLFFGRNSGSGLRCVYHGWKFDVAGRCVDMPSEPPDSTFKNRVRAVAYPCQERCGVVWAYLGPRETPPPLPDLEANQLPDGQWNAVAYARACNWLQGLEGDIDTAHVGFLHFGSESPDDVPPGTYKYYALQDRAPKYAVLDTDYGAMYGAYRPAGPGQYYWRIAQFLFPFFTMPPTGQLGRHIVARAWVPMDDEHMMMFMMLPGLSPEVGAMRAAQGVRPPKLLPNTTGWLGRFRLEANEDNDYQLDRDAQERDEEYSGISGIHLQDQAITEHGAGLRPDQGAPRQQRRHGDPGAATPHRGRPGARRGGHRPARSGRAGGLPAAVWRRHPGLGRGLDRGHHGLAPGVCGAPRAGPGDRGRLRVTAVLGYGLAGEDWAG